MLCWPRQLLSATSTLARRRAAWRCGTPGGCALRVYRLGRIAMCHAHCVTPRTARTPLVFSRLASPAWFLPRPVTVVIASDDSSSNPPPFPPVAHTWACQSRLRSVVWCLCPSTREAAQTRALPRVPPTREQEPPASLPLVEPHAASPLTLSSALSRDPRAPLQRPRAPLQQPCSTHGTCARAWARRFAPRWTCPSCPPLLPQS